MNIFYMCTCYTLWVCVRVCVCVYIYIYIYILSSTDRLFLCITTLQRGKTCEMLQAGIETWLTFCHSVILPKSHHHSLLVKEFFYVYIFLHIHYRLQRELNFWEELSYFSLPGSQQIPHVSAHPWGGVYIYIYIYVLVKHTHTHTHTRECQNFFTQ